MDRLFKAEKIETNRELDELRDTGFDFFQGYALEQPTLESSRAVGATQICGPPW